MFTTYVPLKREVRFADQPKRPTESESLRHLQEQNRFPDRAVYSLVPVPISRHSKLIGFERGRKDLQHLLGTKEF